MMNFLPSDLIYQQPHHPDETNHLPSKFHSLKRCVSFSGTERCELDDVNNNSIYNGEDELSDDGFSQVGGEKKRRLKAEQVKALEKSFVLGNKLEPERKLELAKALGLQPRQIAIWFQNRRARWKTKQIEKDYDLLKKQFEAVKAHNDALHAHNKQLHAQLLALKNREPAGPAPTNLKKEDEESWSFGTEGNSDVIDMSRPLPQPATYQFSSDKHLFPSSLRPEVLPEPNIIQCQKMDQMVQDDGLICNMLGGMEDRPGLWSWSEQHHFN